MPAENHKITSEIETYESVTAAGETYILNAYSKRHTFAPQVVAATEDLTGLNFIGQGNDLQNLAF